MVYSALQIVTRGRDVGVSVVDLGKISGYDQKTCFYVVKQLLEMDLMYVISLLLGLSLIIHSVKLRRGGNTQNFCVHKYFFQCSPLWKQVREEEARAAIGAPNGDAEGQSTDSLQFDPIGPRHISSINVLRSRVVRLLNQSKNNMHAYHNFSARIVCTGVLVLGG